jgi:hypothetical protein
LVILPFFFYTLFSKNLLHPEKASPFYYLFAFLYGLWVLLKLRGTPSFVRFIWIPILALFGLLEETSYGMELGWYEPFTVGSPDLLFQDFHNFIHIFWRWVQAQLGLGKWNPDLYKSFLIIDVGILVFLMLWLSFVRRSNRMDSVKERLNQVFQFSLLGSALISVVCVFWLLLLPRDPNNAFFLGFSLVRLGEILFFVLIAVLPCTIYGSTHGKEMPKFIELTNRFFLSARHRWIFPILVSGALLSGLIYSIFVCFTSSPEEISLITRIAPLLGWIIAQAALLLLAFALWHDHLRKPVSAYINGFFTYFWDWSSLIYVVAAVTLLIVAEALDRDYFFLPDTSSLGGVLARDWHVWTEETFELIAAIQLAAAVYFFPLPRKSK